MNLSEMFAQSQGQPLTIQGRTVHPIYRRRVQPNEQIRLTICSFRSSPVQGIRLKLQSGKIRVADSVEPQADTVMWTDTAPNVGVLRCITGEPTELRMWNCWRDDRNIMQAWIGNAAIEIVENVGGRTRLQCNSSIDLTFEDLVFELEGHD